MSIRATAEKIVAKHCAGWSEEKKASLINDIVDAAIEYGEEQFSDGLSAATDDC